MKKMNLVKKVLAATAALAVAGFMFGCSNSSDGSGTGNNSQIEVGPKVPNSPVDANDKGETPLAQQEDAEENKEGEKAADPAQTADPAKPAGEQTQDPAAPADPAQNSTTPTTPEPSTPSTPEAFTGAVPAGLLAEGAFADGTYGDGFSGEFSLDANPIAVTVKTLGSEGAVQISHDTAIVGGKKYLVKFDIISDADADAEWMIMSKTKYNWVAGGKFTGETQLKAGKKVSVSETIAPSTHESWQEVDNYNIIIKFATVTKYRLTNLSITEAGVDEGYVAPEPAVTPATGPAYELDFTSLGGSTITAGIDFVQYDSVSGESKGSITGDGLVLNVANSWDGAFKVATSELDMSAVTKIVMEYKLSDGWEWTDAGNKKFNVMLVSEENASYKAVKVNLADFAEGASNTEFKSEDQTNIYPKTWEDCVAADMSKIIAIKLNTMSGKGTVTIKSIKFYK